LKKEKFFSHAARDTPDQEGRGVLNAVEFYAAVERGFADAEEFRSGSPVAGCVVQGFADGFFFVKCHACWFSFAGTGIVIGFAGGDGKVFGADVVSF
jgi:hypothetical protein